MSNPRQIPVGRGLRGWAKPYPADTGADTRHLTPETSPGFTLIELITSIMALMVVVTATALLFASSKRSAEIGMTRTGVSSDAAMALSVIRQDLEQAICGNNYCTFALQDDRLGLACYGSAFPESELNFVRLNDDSAATNARSIQEVMYWVRQATNNGVQSFELVRGHMTVLGSGASNGCLSNFEWYRDPSLGEGRQGGDNAEVVARNLAAFEVRACPASLAVTNEYLSTANGQLLPAYLDIFIELLDDQAVHQAAGISGATQGQFVDRVAIRYSTRIFLPNRAGYVR